MSDSAASLLARLRQPEYTGANRCLPCTVVNVAMALVGSLLLAALAPIGVAAVALVGALAVIYLRGYLVPGTPTLTKRYLPDRVLAYFEKAPPGAAVGEEQSFETIEKVERERAAGVDPETFLRDVGAVEACDDGDEGEERDGSEESAVDSSPDRGVRAGADDPARCLTDDFAAAVDDALDSDLDPDDPAVIAPLFDAAPDDVTRESQSYPRYKVGVRIRKWPTEAALGLDVASDAALADWTDRWRDVPVRQRQAARYLLRSLHERCPDCGGELQESERTVESCCRSGEVVSVECADCGQRVLESAP